MPTQPLSLSGADWVGRISGFQRLGSRREGAVPSGMTACV